MYIHIYIVVRVKVHIHIVLHIHIHVHAHTHIQTHTDGVSENALRRRQAMLAMADLGAGDLYCIRPQEACRLLTGSLGFDETLKP